MISWAVTVLWATAVFLTPTRGVILPLLLAGWMAHHQGVLVGNASAAPASVDESSCRCAVLYSGHVRSFAQPRVHLSHKKHLIEQLEKDCQVDVFMYISVQDEVPIRHRLGDFGDALAFTPYSPKYPEVDVAVRLLSPISVEFHEEKAQSVPNGCEASCELNAFWQLYKMQAVYRMMEGHEVSTGRPYTWVIRSRLDIAWMLPIPPLSRFSSTRVYAGHNFFPLADQVLLMPRRFAPTVFEAVSLCYDCEILKAQRESKIQAQTESLLRVALRQDDGHGGIVPFGYYEFPVVIVRNNEGGVCEVLHPHKFACEILRASGLTTPLTTTGHDRELLATDYACMKTMNRWYRQACVTMFPPLEHDETTAGFDTGNNGKRGNSGSVSGIKKIDFAGGVDARDGHAEQQRQHGYVAGGGHGETASNGVVLIPRARGADAQVVSFTEATNLVEGIGRDLTDLLRTLRVHVTPGQDRQSYFLAHHYPFHQPQANPRIQKRGLLDQIAIIEGYDLSESDFNRVALAFSCFLSDSSAAAAAATGLRKEGGKKEERRGGSSESPRTGGKEGQEGGEDGDESRGAWAAEGSGGRGSAPLVVLGTTAAEAGLVANVNCSLVESFHDVWMSLLDTKFEPSEPVCRGPASPCLQRALEQSKSRRS